MNNRGATLLEVVVVTAILSVLLMVAWLLIGPAVKVKGLETRIRSDLKQIVTAINIYAADHDGKLPPREEVLPATVPRSIPGLPRQGSISGSIVGANAYFYSMHRRMQIYSEQFAKYPFRPESDAVSKALMSTRQTERRVRSVAFYHPCQASPRGEGIPCSWNSPRWERRLVSLVFGFRQRVCNVFLAAWENEMNKMFKAFGALSMLSVFVCVAMASGLPCANGYPACPDINGPNGQGSSGSGCPEPNAWDFGEMQQMTFYICNGKDPKCARSGSNCNVIVSYSGFGRVLTCEPAGFQRTCMISSRAPTPLNIKCEDGQKCDPNGPTDTIPDTIPGSGHPLLGINPIELPDL